MLCPGPPLSIAMSYPFKLGFIQNTKRGFAAVPEEEDEQPAPERKPLSKTAGEGWPKDAPKPGGGEGAAADDAADGATVDGTAADPGTTEADPDELDLPEQVIAAHSMIATHSQTSRKKRERFCVHSKSISYPLTNAFAGGCIGVKVRKCADACLCGCAAAPVLKCGTCQRTLPLTCRCACRPALQLCCEPQLCAPWGRGEPHEPLLRCSHRPVASFLPALSPAAVCSRKCVHSSAQSVHSINRSRLSLAGLCHRSPTAMWAAMTTASASAAAAAVAAAGAAGSWTARCCTPSTSKSAAAAPAYQVRASTLCGLPQIPALAGHAPIFFHQLSKSRKSQSAVFLAVRMLMCAI